MKFNHKQYEKFALSLLQPDVKENIKCRSTYLVAKLASEVGEFVGLLAKEEYHNKPVSMDNKKLELGDICWYMYVLNHFYGDGTLYEYIDNYSCDSPNPDELEISSVLETGLKMFTPIYGLVFLQTNTSFFAQEQITTHLKYLYKCYFDIITLLKLSHTEVLAANREKLLKRFPKGTYDSAFYLLSKDSV